MALSLFFLLGIGEWWLLQPANVLHKEPIAFMVSRGEGVREIGTSLKKQGLIKSAVGFKIYSLMTGEAARFKPGMYNLSPASSGAAIAAVLSQGMPGIAVVIKEGATVVDIDRVLAGAGIIRPGELIDYAGKEKRSLEGFLFPDTYMFSAGSRPEIIVRIMKDNFNKQIGPLITGQEEKDWYPDLILSSLVEKEALYPADQRMMAGVLKNRLKIGMALQVDAANVYIKCKAAYMTCSAEDRELTKNDLAVENPYNTYRHTRLPPTPIANPGRAAFAAAQNPQKSSYLYYISNPKTGHLIFAATLEEHAANRNKYHVN